MRIPIFLFATCLIPASILSLTESAPAGEPGGFLRHKLLDENLRTEGGKAPLVVVGKVTEAGPASGDGWAFSSRNEASKFMVAAKVDIEQEAVIEVSEVLRGGIEAKAVRLKIDGLNIRQCFMWNYFFAQKPMPHGGVKLDADYFVLAKDATYIFFLNEAKPAEAKDAPPTVTVFAGAWPVASDPKRMDKVRKVFKTLREWDEPAALTEEEAAAAGRNVAGLDDDDFAVREKAEAALRSLGPRARPLLEKAATDAAPERARRAADILWDLKPEVGKTVIPWNKDPVLSSAASWQAGQNAAEKAQLVMLGRVAGLGKVKGRGWSRPLVDAANPPDPAKMFVAEVDLRQEVLVEVREVLFGKFDGKSLLVRADRICLPMQPVQTLWQKYCGHNVDYTDQAVPARYFQMAKGETFLFFLGPVTESTGENPPKATQLPEFFPFREPRPDDLASIEDFCARLAEWRDPPKLPPEEDARTRAMITDLGSNDFDKREKAETEIRKLALRVKPYLDEAARDKDPERSFRARELLKSLEPVAGEAPRDVKAAPEAKPVLPAVPAPAKAPAEIDG